LKKKSTTKKAVKPESKAKSEATKVKAEPMDIDNTKKRPLECGDTPAARVKREKKIKKEEDDPDLYKWWEEEDAPTGEVVGDGEQRWKTLSHNGVFFPPAYVPHGVKMKFDGKPITLTPEAEEVASFYATLLETDHGKNPVFQKNFFNDWVEILKEDPSVRS
jgi:DNA topoisomerase-1